MVPLRCWCLMPSFSLSHPPFLSLSGSFSQLFPFCWALVGGIIMRHQQQQCQYYSSSPCRSVVAALAASLPPPTSHTLFLLVFLPLPPPKLLVEWSPPTSSWTHLSYALFLLVLIRLPLTILSCSSCLPFPTFTATSSISYKWSKANPAMTQQPPYLWVTRIS